MLQRNDIPSGEKSVANRVNVHCMDRLPDSVPSEVCVSKRITHTSPAHFGAADVFRQRSSTARMAQGLLASITWTILENQNRMSSNTRHFRMYSRSNVSVTQGSSFPVLVTPVINFISFGLKFACEKTKSADMGLNDLIHLLYKRSIYLTYVCTSSLQNLYRTRLPKNPSIPLCIQRNILQIPDAAPFEPCTSAKLHSSPILHRNAYKHPNVASFDPSTV